MRAEWGSTSDLAVRGCELCCLLSDEECLELRVTQDGESATNLHDPLAGPDSEPVGAAVEDGQLELATRVGVASATVPVDELGDFGFVDASGVLDRLGGCAQVVGPMT